MDNLGSHRSGAIRRTLMAAGAKLFFLPKYSPDLNPIEMLFSKLKHGLREAAKPTRTPSSICYLRSTLTDAQTTSQGWIHSKLESSRSSGRIRPSPSACGAAGGHGRRLLPPGSTSSVCAEEMPPRLFLPSISTQGQSGSAGWAAVRGPSRSENLPPWPSVPILKRHKHLRLA
jgi:transposase